jgi:hippurate hydrolase
MDEAYSAALAQIRPQLADLYRDLHEHPELSLCETRTAALVAERLRGGGYEVTEGVGGTGVVGLLRNGPGPVVLLRADMDALPVAENTGLPYASTARAVDHEGREVPVMHACGHDVHTACLVGAASLLAGSALTWSGTLLVVFQPAEELGTGARAMVEDGLFERFGHPDIVLGQHVVPAPAGMIGYGSGPMMSASDTVHVVLHGRGGHGARPQAALDPVLMAAHIVVRLQGIVAREVTPGETAVVTVGRLHAGTKGNIIPGTAELDINMRTYSESARALVQAAIERIVRAEAQASGAPREPEFTWSDGFPVLTCDPEATRATVEAFTREFGAERLIETGPVTASEDVSVFGAVAKAPTVFWFLGGTEPATAIAAFSEGRMDELPANHSPEFAPVIEPTLSMGVEALITAALAWLDGAGEQSAPAATVPHSSE